MVIGVAIGAWSGAVAILLGMCRAAQRADGLLTARPRAARDPAARRERLLLAAQVVLLVLAALAAAASSRAADWEPLELVALLAVLAVGSDFLTLDATRFRISGAFLAIVLAMALLGPAPAVAIGVLCGIVDGLRARHRASDLASNLATYAIFPLLGGLALRVAGGSDAALRPDDEYALLVFAVFMVANALNFLLIAGHGVLLRGGSLGHAIRAVYLPVLPWELASALVTAAAVFGYQRSGPVVIGIFALSLGVCQLLLKALLQGQVHFEQLRRRTEEIDVRHERMLGLMLHTLSLRDPTAARHAAAVALYARELARAAGMSDREQALAHTAGLLHDIGREAFPDSILVAERELGPEERRFVHRHPVDGARLLRDVPGLQAVAGTVLAHHERPDGRGYPTGVSGEDIPRTARVVAIAEVYDALTARDSYRRPLMVTEALVELRRVAGTQLDAALVEIFIALVRERGGPGFRPKGDADLESELRRVRSTPLEAHF